MDRETVRFGILGCGTVAGYHAAAIRATAGAELVCACGNTAGPAERFCREQGIDRMQSYAEMLERPDVNAISICTPSGLHGEEAVAALRAGKHLVIEKPISIQNADADRILAAAEATDRTVCVISQFRFSDAAQEIHRAMEEGAFGKLVSAALTMRYYRGQSYYDSGAWRGTKALDGGGVLMNQGIHGVDLLAYLMGPVVELTGYTRTRLRKIEVEDTACAVLNFKNGAIGTIDATVCNRGGSPLRIEICGEYGSVVLEDEAITFWGLDRPCCVPVGIRSESSAAASPTGISTENHTRQFENFVAAVHGQEPVAVSVRDGRHALQIVCGVYESARLHRPVALAY